jgi:radial spoke head protein 4/6
LKQLVEKSQYDKIRFWGKIFGTQKNYYIVEVEQHEDDDDNHDISTHENENMNENNDNDVDDDDPLPKTTFKPPAIVPNEERGTGVNKYTYLVCNHRRHH